MRLCQKPSSRVVMGLRCLRLAHDLPGATHEHARSSCQRSVEVRGVHRPRLSLGVLVLDPRHLPGVDRVAILDTIIGSPILEILLVLATIVPNLAVGARRLHDIGKSGWLQLIAIIPIIGWIILIVWFATDSEPDNGYGPNPKESREGSVRRSDSPSTPE